MKLDDIYIAANLKEEKRKLEYLLDKITKNGKTHTQYLGRTCDDTKFDIPEEAIGIYQDFLRQLIECNKNKLIKLGVEL